MRQYFFLALLFLAVSPAYGYNSGFQPVYQPPGAGGSNPSSIHNIGNVTETGCALAQYLSVNATGFFVCTTLSGTGEVNTASNVGTDTGIFRSKVGFDLTFKSLRAGSGITLTAYPDEILINSTGSAGNATNLDDLGDVTITTPSHPSILFYDDGIGNWINKIFSINTQSATNGTYVTGINNQTGVITTQTLTSKTCSGTDKLYSYDFSTGIGLCSEDHDTADQTTASNIGFGQGLFSSEVGNDLQFKGIDVTGDLSISSNATDIIINHTPTPSSGFTNIASSPQTTAVLISDNSTVSGSATFKTLTQSTGITITNNTKEIVIATTPGAFKNPLLDGSNHTDTVAQTVSRGSLIYGDQTPKWNELNIGSGGSFLYSNGTDTSWLVYQVWNQSATNGVFITGINNSTGVITTQTFKHNTLSPVNGTFITGIDNNTGVVSTLTFQVNNQSVTAGTVITGINNVTGVISTTSLSGLTSLANNVTSTTATNGTVTSLWNIPLTASSGNTVSGVVSAVSNATGNAVQLAINVTQSGSSGFCNISTPVSISAVNLDIIPINSTRSAADTLETVWYPPLERALPISFNCSVFTGSTPGNLAVWFQPEVSAGKATILAGSYYTKTP